MRIYTSEINNSLELQLVLQISSTLQVSFTVPRISQQNTEPHVAMLPDRRVGNVWTPSWTAKTRAQAAAKVAHFRKGAASGERSWWVSKKLKVATPTSEVTVIKEDTKYIVRREWLSKSLHLLSSTKMHQKAR